MEFLNQQTLKLALTPLRGIRRWKIASSGILTKRMLYCEIQSCFVQNVTSSRELSSRKCADVNIHEMDFGQWVSDMLMHLIGEAREQFCIIIWALWNNRNQRLWKNSIVTPQKCVKNAMEFLRQYIEANIKLEKIMDFADQRSTTRRTKPPEEGVKMTIDAALEGENRKIGFGMVIRGHKGADHRLYMD
ncbi:hypothetical protein DITRI_Ditri19aG0104100 [Diplodiscus trichospermus]